MMEKQRSLLPGIRPTPDFAAVSPFSQRKRSPFRAVRPPKAPAKSCPPVSRIFPTPKHSYGPQVVSFKSERTQDVMSSPHYKSKSDKTYFEQCFRVREKLGEGSFGEVYRVCSREDGRMYAVKKSCQPFRGEWDKRQKLREVEKQEQLPQHSNCVRFHKAWEEMHILYIQTELCRMSLAEYADLHGKVSERRIWHILIDLVKGLKHLHDHQLCHLDIKPANIFLGEDEFTCKVGDFGLCSNVEQGFPDAMEGDAKYLAPELMGHQFGKPADIFSLGISLLELACDLELPAGGENWHLLRNGHIPLDQTKDLSRGLVSILSRMMHPDPKLRPTVDEILADPCVVMATYQHVCYKASYWLFSTCKHMLLRILAVFMFLLSIFPVRRAGDIVQDSSWSAEVNPGTRPSLQSLHNDSLSDDDDELLHSYICDDGSDPNAKFNRSWIKNSPVRYPSDIYAGPPIPINFDDSSPERVSSLLPKNMSSPLSSSLPRYRTTNGMASHNRLLTVEPKKLMEAFVD